MPKYYRFRALTPTRQPKRSRDKKKERQISRPETGDMNCLASLALDCSPAMSWYLRRTSWRRAPPLVTLPRQFSANLRASLHLNNRSVIMLKVLKM